MFFSEHPVLLLLLLFILLSVLLLLHLHEHHQHHQLSTICSDALRLAELSPQLQLTLPYWRRRGPPVFLSSVLLLRHDSSNNVVDRSNWMAQAGIRKRALPGLTRQLAMLLLSIS